MKTVAVRIMASAIAIPVLWIMHIMLQTYVTASDFIVPVTAAIVLLAGVRIVFGGMLDSNLLKRRVLVLGAGDKAAFSVVGMFV